MEICTLLLLPRTPKPREWVKRSICILVRDHPGPGDAEHGRGMPAGQGTAQHPAGSDEPGAIQAPHEEQETLAELRIKRHSYMTGAAKTYSLACAPRERAVCSELTWRAIAIILRATLPSLFHVGLSLLPDSTLPTYHLSVEQRGPKHRI